MGKPPPCGLGFHKWRNYGEEVGIFYSEERPSSQPIPGQLRARRTRGEAVFERRKRKRFGIKLRRTLEKNPDGTLFCVGWEPGTEKTGEG